MPDIIEPRYKKVILHDPTGAAVSTSNKLPVDVGTVTVTGTVTATPTGTQNVDVTGNTTGLATGSKQDTGNTSLSSIDTKTPALGQALAASSTPVVLTATQITTLTPIAGLTDAQLRATAVPVSGTFYPATQPVSGTVDTELPTASVMADGLANPTSPIIGSVGLDFNGTTYDRQRHSFQQTTTGITANSNGTAIDMTTDPKRMCSIVAIIVGDTSTFDVRLEGSLNNSNWTELLAITNVSPGDGKLGFSVDKPVLYIRYRVAGITRVSGSLSIIILAVE